MQKESCTMIFSTCEEYSFLWKLFFMSFEKYWPEFDMPIISTASSDFEYGKYRIKGTPEGDDKSWSGRLIETLHMVETDIVFFSLDDFVLPRKVDNEFVSHALDIMISDPSVKGITLQDFVSDKEYAKCDYDEYFCVKKNNLWYSIVTQAGFWRKDYLLKVLRHRESAWAFEKMGSGRQRIYRGKLLYRKDKYNDRYYYPLGGIHARGKLKNNAEVDAIVKEFGVDREACQLKDNATIRQTKRSFIKKVNGKLYRWFSGFFPNSHYSENM